MHAAEAGRPRRPGSGAVAAAAICAALLGLLAGCSSDESSAQPSLTARPAAQPAAPRAATTSTQGTTDTGSRLVDFTAPVGGLTVETPPLRVRRRTR